jgi:hypothetical protein
MLGSQRKSSQTCCAVWYTGTNISEENATLIFRLPSSLKMKASSQMLVPIYQLTKHHIPVYCIWPVWQSEVMLTCKENSYKDWQTNIKHRWWASGMLTLSKVNLLASFLQSDINTTYFTSLWHLTQSVCIHSNTI